MSIYMSIIIIIYIYMYISAVSILLRAYSPTNPSPSEKHENLIGIPEFVNPHFLGGT